MPRTISTLARHGQVSEERITSMNEHVKQLNKSPLQEFWRKNGIGYVFLLPFLVLFAVFVILPIIIAVVLSVTNYNMIQDATWAGLANYKNLFLNDNVFLTALKNTFVFALFIGPIGYLLSFFMAWLINSMKFRRFLTLAFYAPSICSGIAMATVWLTLFSNDRTGYINNFLLNIGIISEPILWNQSAQYIFPAVIIMSVWMSMGSGFLVFLAGLQGLPGEVFEAGKIDGVKNRWQELAQLVLPLMKPQLLFGAINAIVGSFSVFDVVYQFAGMPTPNYAGHTIVAHLYDYAFLRFQMGYASAVSVVLFLITFILGRVVMRVLRSDD